MNDAERPQQYLTRAEELRRQAEAAHDPGVKIALLKLAALWARLATRAKIILVVLLIQTGACCAADIHECIMVVGHCIHCASGHCPKE